MASGLAMLSASISMGFSGIKRNGGCMVPGKDDKVANRVMETRWIAGWHLKKLAGMLTYGQKRTCKGRA